MHDKQPLRHGGQAVPQSQPPVILVDPGGLILDKNLCQGYPKLPFEIIHTAKPLPELVLYSRPCHELRTVLRDAVQTLHHPAIQVQVDILPRVKSSSRESCKDAMVGSFIPRFFPGEVR